MATTSPATHIHLPVALLVDVGVRGAPLAVPLGRVADPAVYQGDIADHAHRDAQESQACERGAVGR